MSETSWWCLTMLGWFLMMQDDDWWCLVTPGEEVRGRAVLKYIKTNTTTNPNDCATKPKIYQISVWYPAYRCPGGVGLNRANLILAQAVKLYRYRSKSGSESFYNAFTHTCMLLGVGYTRSIFRYWHTHGGDRFIWRSNIYTYRKNTIFEDLAKFQGSPGENVNPAIFWPK